MQNHYYNLSIKIQINGLLARVHSPPPINFEWILLYSKGHDCTAMDNGFDVNIIIHILTDICKWITNIEMIIGNTNRHEYDTNDDNVYIQLTTMKNIMQNKAAFTIKNNKEIRYDIQSVEDIDSRHYDSRHYVLIELLILLGIYASKGDLFNRNKAIYVCANKLLKKTYRKNVSHPTKILAAKGKKIKKFKSCSKCIIKGWYKFGMLFFVTR